MAIGRVVVTIPNVLLGARGPLSSNTLHFNAVGAPDVDGTIATALLDKVEDCWTSLAPLYNNGAANSILLSVYNLADPEPRTAVAIREVAFAHDTTSLPTECAINVHFRAPRVSGVPSQRGRACVQIGPLSVDCLDTATGQINATTYSIVTEAFEVMAADGNVLYPWVVGSEAHGFNEPSVAYVNNEFGSVGSRQGVVSASSQITLP